MKSLYNKSTHSFQEQQIPLPDQRDYVGNDKGYAEAYHAYAHQQPTRTIACRPGDVWEEGKIYEEGKDYRVAKIERISSGNSQKIDDVFEIVPLAPPAQEAELWEECAKVIAGYYVRIDAEAEKGNNGSAESWQEQMIEYLQQKYHLSIKSEQSEAIEFGDFLKSYIPVKDGSNEIIWKNKSDGKYFTTAKLYQLFKQKKAP